MFPKDYTTIGCGGLFVLYQDACLLHSHMDVLKTGLTVLFMWIPCGREIDGFWCVLVKEIVWHDKPIKVRLRHVLLFPGFAATFIRKSYDVRRVDITPLEQRKVTFDTHALVQDLEAHGKWYQINNSKEDFFNIK